MSTARVGVLALQGAFREHRHALERQGADVQEVRLPEQLAGLAGLIIPGGESTTMAKLIRNYGFDEAIPAFYQTGAAVWGTCAGAITIARDIIGYPEQLRLNLLDIAVERNAYGRQVASFEVEVALEPAFGAGLSSQDRHPFHTIFIRAPRIASIGSSVTVLAQHAGDPIMVVQGRVMATVFHPELATDDRIHQYFLEQLVATT
jgi:5'-phosphate synthase pdxT subunit